ncbi:biotin--[acetyl-CoA-carboxylase] ligase [Companilactobacillus jidongensis]|uniref:biotin--[acetyl-CoA-carboxylase] ligase n=1 Tax=Companilactobacillus jidongensis TaxID=2486006 RepID=UPI0013DE2B7E|nr:biotin--[acetyl-CoA-carboxylase] ligase [Companilactobacillus jidongensis]
MTNKPLNKSEIQARLNTPIKILKFNKIDSTNTFSKEYIVEHHNGITAVIAETQTNGYGRFQREFYSPQNTGIYLSIIIHTDKVIPGLLTTMTGLAIVKALKKSFHKADLKLKWINDILLNGKKIGGILAENIPDDNKNNLIIGIGINLNTIEFPNELKKIVGSISDDPTIDRNKIIADILNCFFEQFKTYQTGDFLPEYCDLCDTLNRTVRITNGKQKIIGQAIDIATDGSLVLLDNKKLRHVINSGEVTKVYLE